MSEAKKRDKSGIEWGLFSSEYMKIEDGDSVDVVLNNWRQTETTIKGEKKSQVSFSVLRESGEEVNKQFDVLSKGLVTALKPLVQKAEKAGQTKFRCLISRTGTGDKTRYAVKELEL